MPGHECYHCRQWIEAADKKSHDCWTTTEENLTRELPESLMDAWYRLRETAAGFGEQRVYASHKSIMFSRKACYFFVRPQKKYLELCFFLGRTLKNPLIHKAQPSSRVKVGHIVRVQHYDEVEAPLTDWLREAYEKSDELTATRLPGKAKPKTKSKPKKTEKKTAATKKPKAKRKR